MKAAMLIDITKCAGCQACVSACKEVNGLPRDGGDRLSDTTFSIVEARNGSFVKRQCMHCEDPACASVCPVGALKRSAEGPVTYDGGKCMGCRYCMVACPFNIPKYQWNETIPLVRKCEMCHEKLVSRGQQPACANACPTGATTFGDRDELLQEAHRRIRETPGRYVDKVYGEKEAGGTSVLYLSAVPFEQLGFTTKVQTSPYPALTWYVLSKLPPVVSTAGAGLIGITWIIKRRQKLAEERGEHAHHGAKPHHSTHGEDQ